MYQQPADTGRVQLWSLDLGLAGYSQPPQPLSLNLTPISLQF